MPFHLEWQSWREGWIASLCAAFASKGPTARPNKVRCLRITNGLNGGIDGICSEERSDDYRGACADTSTSEAWNYKPVA